MIKTCAFRTGLGRSPEQGYREYVIAGQRLLDHGTLVSPFIPDESVNDPSFLMPPLYAGVVAAAYGTLGVESFAATLLLQIINALSTSAAVFFTFLIARRVGAGSAAWLAAGVAAVNPTLFGFTDYIWDTSLFTAGVTFAVYIALRLSDQPLTWGRWGAFGAYLGGLALLNPALTVAYPLLVLWPLHRSKRLQWRPIVRCIAASVVGWLIAIGPWTVRNYIHFGKPIYVRGGFGLDLWLGVCPEAEKHGANIFNAQFPLNNPEVQERVSELGEQAFIAQYRQRAVAEIVENPLRYVRLIAVRFVDYWTGSLFSHAGPGKSGWPKSASRAVVLLFLTGEVLLIAVCLGLRGRVDRDVLWLGAILLSFSIVYCLTHVELRYRAPTEALMAVVVSVAVARAFAGSASTAPAPH